MKSFFVKYQIYFATLISVFAYLIFGYFFEREQFYSLLVLYSFAFLGMVLLIKSGKNDGFLFKIGLLFRILFLFSTPALSQDFYRFIWDGHAILNNINPFIFKPDTILNTLATFPNAAFLHQKMGALSASHFSNYPPINQLFFVIAAFIGGKSIFVSMLTLRSFIILADIGIYFYGKKILAHFKKNTSAIFWYFLNPLVLLELTGNLHFEGVMLCFFVIGLYFLIYKKWLTAAVLVALSISVKLLTLLLIPLFYKYLGFKKSILFYSIIVLLNILFFLPFLNQTLLENYRETLALYFTNFEFNASFYYIAREIGFHIKGYNTIGIIGSYTPYIIIGFVLFFTFLRKNKSIAQIALNALFIFTLYLFISTTVHPWYVINLILLSVFTKYKFPIVWSFTIILSYYAYSISPFKENMVLLFLEYSMVLATISYEVFYRRLIQNKNINSKIANFWGKIANIFDT